mmetsp:Transcript_6523/g.13496  ORF Transcript_6523/g.13496 Transcript_6523/m.13496 type:complete len:212 (+) Transcript_6523:241-876(+)
MRDVWRPQHAFVRSATRQPNDHMDGCPTLDVVVREGAAVLELAASPDQALRVGSRTVIVLDLGLDVLHRIRWLSCNDNLLASDRFGRNIKACWLIARGGATLPPRFGPSLRLWCRPAHRTRGRGRCVRCVRCVRGIWPLCERVAERSFVRSDGTAETLVTCAPIETATRVVMNEPALAEKRLARLLVRERVEDVAVPELIHPRRWGEQCSV